MRVLVVEDDKVMRDLLVKVFDFAGYSTAAAAGGEEALRMLANSRFDLLLSDIYMHPVDGWALASHARALVPPIKVFLITAYGDAEDERRARAGGADGYMSKPFSLADLLSAVRTMVLKSQ